MAADVKQCTGPRKNQPGCIPRKKMVTAVTCLAFDWQFVKTTKVPPAINSSVFGLWDIVSKGGCMRYAAAALPAKLARVNMSVGNKPTLPRKKSDQMNSVYLGSTVRYVTVHVVATRTQSIASRGCNRRNTQNNAKHW